MSVTLQLDLPDELLDQARANGVLNSSTMVELIAREIERRKAAAELGKILDGIRALPGEPMTPEEIQEEINEVRKARRASEVGP